ncbi:MAG: hypothetical protein H5T99_05370 [Moorella sp. (in: Bacteria)]|nr:hypothetical protein [Moorella sp. (in: firmicutes)]
MEQVVARENMRVALKRVEENGGAAGIDGVQVTPLRTSYENAGPRFANQTRMPGGVKDGG